MFESYKENKLPSTTKHVPKIKHHEGVTIATDKDNVDSSGWLQTLNTIEMSKKSGVMTRSQPLCTDVPHLCMDLSHAHGPFQRSVIECTATDHVIFPRCIYTSFHGNLLPLVWISSWISPILRHHSLGTQWLRGQPVGWAQVRFGLTVGPEGETSPYIWHSCIAATSYLMIVMDLGATYVVWHCTLSVCYLVCEHKEKWKWLRANYEWVNGQQDLRCSRYGTKGQDKACSMKVALAVGV